MSKSSSFDDFASTPDIQAELKAHPNAGAALKKYMAAMDALEENDPHLYQVSLLLSILTASTSFYKDGHIKPEVMSEMASKTLNQARLEGAYEVLNSLLSIAEQTIDLKKPPSAQPENIQAYGRKVLKAIGNQGPDLCDQRRRGLEQLANTLEAVQETVKTAKTATQETVASEVTEAKE